MATIMFDIDGVLADFIGGFTKCGQKAYPDLPDANTHTQVSWDFPHITSMQAANIWQHFHTSSSAWISLQPLIDAPTFKRIDALRVRHEVYFVSARAGVDAKQQTEWWLQWHGVMRPTVILTKRKGEFAKVIDVGYSIEDKLSNANCIAWFTDHSAQSYLIRRLYNASPISGLAKNVEYIETVEQYLNILESL